MEYPDSLAISFIVTIFFFPYLVLDIKKYKTIPIVIQYLKGGYGAVDWGTMMAMLVLAIVPIVVFYVACQKYIIEGVVAGAITATIIKKITAFALAQNRLTRTKEVQQ